MAGRQTAMVSEEDRTIPSSTMSKLTRTVLDDTFYNIIHDIVSKVHREEKMARMRSAVAMAKKLGEEEAARLQENDPADQEKGTVEPGATGPSSTMKKDRRPVRIETDGAVYDNGKVYLKGNPLKTTKEILCPNCRLPRLLYPLSGIGSRPPPDPYKEYCRKHPPVIMPGHDVHGNQFATDKINRKKKAQPQPQQTNSNTPGSSPPSTPSTPATSFKQITAEKVSFPTVKCPNCPRYFVVTRVAQHLDRCMGLSGRQANRNRATPLENTSGTSTPTMAAAAKPSPLKRALPNGDEDAGSASKKKKLNTPKKYSGKKPAPPSKLKNGTTPDMAAMGISNSSGIDPSGSGNANATGKKKSAPAENRPGKLKSR
ncbi:hypothetical protein FQN53_002491 [Emmonsiellopsis sp. PD_33]|nr:hypothetical protein FQN53_002491 [Emmonsiellopsis sp. PD_33]KAK2787827.1 hypothetical protein FQN51_003067 [Onygenales sp. PD_10]